MRIDSIPTQAIRQLQDRLPTDDLEVSLDDRKVWGLAFINTVVARDQFYNEITLALPMLDSTPGMAWKTVFPRAKPIESVEEAVTDLMLGHVILVHEEWECAVSIPLWHTKTRAIEMPKYEKVIIGPQESFNEDLETNIGLIRRWVRDPELSVRYYEVGRRSKSKVALCYIRDITNPGWVDEIDRAIRDLDVDLITGHTDLMDLLIQPNQSVFPLYQLTELPARVQVEMNTGRIVLFAEGSPYGIMLPSPVIGLLRESEYLLQSSYVHLFARVLRFIASFLSMYSAAIYLALVSVNTSILPTEISISVSADQQALPYSTFLEVMIMLLVLDIFIEATTFVPGTIGPALNIVGSLIIGQAATQAGLVSSLMVIITAITAVGTYLSSLQLAYAIRIWKYAFVLAAGIFGLYGIVCCMAIQLGHLTGLRTLGLPYLQPMAPLKWKQLLPGLFEIPANRRFKRGTLFQPQDKVSMRRKPNDEQGN
ncbi:spore germination protein [Paenibacillus sp. HJGM_3]|uniref:spore germination protein n=1 Tax=Paenibacillus sp. HJGM_3 TaxID=3379816 RepID=UPI00385AEE40